MKELEAEIMAPVKRIATILGESDVPIEKVGAYFKQGPKCEPLHEHIVEHGEDGFRRALAEEFEKTVREAYMKKHGYHWMVREGNRFGFG